MRTLPLVTAALAACGLITFSGCKPSGDAPAAGGNPPAGKPTIDQAAATSGDWTQWGGTDQRNMYSPAKGLPDRFEPGKLKGDVVDMATTKNVKWVAKLGSQSYGNPTVAKGRVFIGTNNDSPRDPALQGDRSTVYCLDEKTGELLWQLTVPKLKSGKVNDWENLGILSSPTIEGDYVYLVTSRCEVICLDVNGLANGNQGMQDEGKYMSKDTGAPPAKAGPKDADIIWVYDMMDELGVFPHNASNSSPLIIGDRVYVCTSNGQDWTHVNIPSPLSPSYVALDKKTGKLTGEDDANIGPKIYHGQWSSPSRGTINGKDLVFAGGGDGWLYAFSTTTTKKEDRDLFETVFKLDMNPPEYKEKDGKPIKYPAAEGPSEVNATPVFYKNRIYVATGQDPEHGEGIGRLVCADATMTGDITKTGVIWEYRGIHRSISTVSIDPETGLLFIGDFSGFVHCLDAETGKLHWVYDMKAHMWSSTLVADGKVYVGDEDGDFVVLPARKDFDPKKDKPISECNLGSPVYSTPVIANGVIYVASNTHLFAFHDSAKAKPLPDAPAKIEIKK